MSSSNEDSGPKSEIWRRLRPARAVKLSKTELAPLDLDALSKLFGAETKRQYLEQPSVFDLSDRLPQQTVKTVDADTLEPYDGDLI